jgi:hypothetical protein
MLTTRVMIMTAIALAATTSLTPAQDEPHGWLGTETLKTPYGEYLEDARLP